MKYTRRSFLKSSGAMLACSCLGGLCQEGCSSLTGVSSTEIVRIGSFRVEGENVVVDLRKTPSLTAIGGSVKLEFDHPQDGTPTKIILIHPDGSDYPAYANTCTHRGKELEYRHAAAKLECTSGHSKFGLNGQVLEGNADRPLKRYATELSGATLFVFL